MLKRFNQIKQESRWFLEIKLMRNDKNNDEISFSNQLINQQPISNPIKK